MNKIYRLVWNKSLNLWTVVSENARGVTKKRNVATSISIKTELTSSAATDQQYQFKPTFIALALSSVFFSTGTLAAANTGGGVADTGSSMAISPSSAQCGTGVNQATVIGGNGTAIGCGNDISGTSANFWQQINNRRGGGDLGYGTGVSVGGSSNGVASSSTAVGRQNIIRGYGGATVLGAANYSNATADRSSNSTPGNFHNVLIGQGNSSNGLIGYNTLMGVGNRIADDTAVNTTTLAGAGTNSIAIGIANRVTGQTSIAFGRQSYADADYAIAQGSTATVARGATGGIALGNSATTNGIRGVAIGSGTGGNANDAASAPTADGVDSIAVGTTAKATGNETIALGRQSAAGNARDIAIGQGAAAQGVTDNGLVRAAVAVGDTARAAGRNTVALGQNSTASAQGATALSAGAQATGEYSTAAGNQSKATANFSTATGNEAAALAEGATVTGSNATASGIESSAFGAESNASGNRSVAVGAAAVSAGENAVAVGSNANANSANDIAIGNDAATALGSNGNNIAMGNGVTTGATGQNVSIGSDGTTANSATADGGAVAIGRNQIANGDGAVAIGDPNRAMGSGAVALGKDNTAAGDNTASTMANGAVAIGNTNLAVGQGSVALGNTSTAAAAGAIALGDTANAQATRGVALGSGATATNADDVALGAGSVTSAANPTANGTVGGITYGYAGTAPSSVVSVGSAGNERQVTNVAAGRVSESSTDAINGSQLYSTQTALGNLAESTANHLGGGSVVNPDGSVSEPVYALTSNPAANGISVTNNVGDALNTLNTAVNQPLTFTGNSGSTAQQLGSSLAVEGASTTGGSYSGSNLQTVVTQDKILIQMADNPEFTSVTAGDTVINDNGVTITNGPSITKSGINAAGNPITNVGAGVNDTDAVNKGQLDDAAAAAKTEVTEGKNITVTKTTGTDGQDIYNVATANDVAFDSVQVGNVNIDGTTGKISGVAAGDVNATSTDAINGGQLAGTAKSVLDALGGGSTVNPDGTVSAPSYTVNGNNVSNVGDAITELDKGWNLQSNGANAGAIKAGDTVDIGTVTGEENLTVTKNGNTIQYGLNRDLKVNSVTAGDTVINDNGVTITNGPSITKSGINAAGNPITNVGAGVNDTDAVNKGQLDDAAAASKTEVTEGKNITVTKTTGADGQDIYNVATADNVEFNNVTVGGPNGVRIDGTTGKISGVAAGDVNATSTDAINGSQLAGTAKSVSDALGGGSTFNPDGTVSAPSYTVNGNNVSNVGDAITELDKGWNLQSNGANAGAIKAGDTVDIGTVTGEENLTVTKNGNTIQYGLNKDLKVDSVTAGDTVINDNGVTITNGPSITKSGINAAGNPISNVGAGVNDTDAVNKGQLDGAAAAAKTEVTEGKNITVTKTTGTDGQDIYNVATADNVEFNNVKVGDVTIDGTTGKISGVAAGDVNATSTDAINGSQLAGTAKSVSDALGGGSTVNPDGTVSAPSYTVNGNNVSNVGDAITELDKGWNLQSNGANAGAIKAGDTVDIGTVNGEENLTVTKNGNTIQYGLNRDLKVDSVTAGDTVINDNGVTIANGPSITKSGINAAGNPITNVGAGINDTDAVNKGQLDDAAAAAKTEVTEGKNITVTKSTGADGQDIYNVATANDVDFNNVTVGGANGVRIDGTTGKISGVAAGDVNPTSTDAINGSQLAGTAKSVSDALGGGSTVNPDGTVSAPSYTVNGNNVSKVGDAITELDKGWNLQSNGANAGAIKAGDTVDMGTVTGEENLTVTKNGNTIQYGLNRDLKVDSVTAGDTVINDNGVTITNGPSITKSGINAAGNSITNVGAGVNGTDAVNKDQLDNAAATAKTEVTEGKNITVTKTTGADGQDIYNVATANDVAFDSVQVGNVNIDGTTGKISGVAAGDVNATSTDAINGSQLAGTAKSVSDALGGGSTVNPDGTVSAPSYTVNGNNVSNVGDAITELDKGWNLQSNGANAGAIKAGDTVDMGTVTGEENLTVTKNGNTIQYGLNKDLKVDSVTAGDTVINDNGVTITNGPSITKSGINAAGNSITNVGAGVNGTDAVNKDQLDNAAAASKTEVTEGKNITVTKTTGTDGQDIYNVATANDVAFDSVQVGNVNIDGTTGKISGVAAGDVNATSTDAINGSQLAGTAKSVSDALGGGSTVNPDGTVSAPSYTVNGNNVSNVGDAITELDKGWNLQSNGANAGAIKAGDTVDIGTVTGEENLTVTKNGNTIQYGLNKDLKVDSVTAGDTVINTDGVTIANGPSITKSGINAAGNSITNVGAGVNGTDAVNKDQLDNAAATAKTEVTEGKNITVTKTTGTDGQDIYNVATANDVDFNNVTVGGPNGVRIDGTTGKISGVTAGTIAAGSTEAVNGGQLNDSVASTGDILGWRRDQ
ncbi:ESPR-type extended signal peptide-containing protein [Acinetobacter colistiniresistens]|uniref:ESPR-type extended signal peptide-containing protein n=2 Tax=Acinetobacter colistiniresistens TaxID=280145 RepID=UPI003A5C345B